MRNGCNKQNKHLSVDPGILSQEWTRILSCRNGYLSPLWELVYLLVFSLSLSLFFSLFLSLFRCSWFPPSPILSSLSSFLHPPPSSLFPPHPSLSLALASMSSPGAFSPGAFSATSCLSPPCSFSFYLSVSLSCAFRRPPGGRALLPVALLPSPLHPSLCMRIYNAHMYIYLYIDVYIFGCCFLLSGRDLRNPFQAS